jgi:hypothetical protein
MTFVVALVVGLSVIGASRVQAGAAPTLTIHAMECFSGVGSGIFEECHTDFESDTIVGEVGGGTGAIVITDFQGALGAYVYCRDVTDDEVLYDGSYADSGGGVVFPVEDDDEIVCDVYFIFAAGGDDGGGPTTLPSTGSGPLSSNSQLPLFLTLITAVLALFGAQLRRSAR